MRLLRCMLAGVVCVAAACIASVASRADQPIMVRSDDGRRTVPLYTSSHALVIGIDAYKHWSPLRNAVNDAKAVAAELTAQGFDVTLRTDLDQQPLMAAFEDFVSKHGGNPDARLVIWFAGHGHTIKHKYGREVSDEGYIVPADAIDASDDFKVARTLYSMRRFGELMREIRSKHVLAIFDSCFSGTIFKATRAGLAPTDLDRLGRPVRQFISSGEADQTVTDDGLFRKLFIAALRGEEEQADANGDGILTGEELGFYLRSRVASLGGQQTPGYGKMTELGLDLGDVSFKLPVARNTAARSEAERLWSYIKGSEDEETINAFLKQYGPQSAELAVEANNRLAALRSRAEGPPVASAGTTKVRWDWSPYAQDDGNWALKVMRLPSVWPRAQQIIAERSKAQSSTRIALMGTGYVQAHRDLPKPEATFGGLPADGGERSPPFCSRGQKTHAAGLVAAGIDERGIQGVGLGRRLLDLPLTRELAAESARDVALERVSFFMDALVDLVEFLEQLDSISKDRLIVHLPIVYNWSSVASTFDADPLADRQIRDQVHQHAKVVQSIVRRYADRVLFVAVAGNDSENRGAPVAAEYASPFGYAATHRGAGFVPSGNILVVEATDRSGARAGFSNVGGHVSAPGVDIMSTSAERENAYMVCSGTAEASALAAGLAALLWDTDPTLKPEELITIMRQSGTPPRSAGAAPRLDALAAFERVQDRLKSKKP
jgi:subtilisin family serine protease